MRKVNLQVIKEPDLLDKDISNVENESPNKVTVVYTVKIKTALFEEITVKMYELFDEDTKCIVELIPALDISGYGKNSKEAGGMALFCLDSYFKNLIKAKPKDLKDEMDLYKILKLNENYMSKENIIKLIRKADLSEEQLQKIYMAITDEYSETYTVKTKKVVTEDLKTETMYEKEAIEKMIFNLFRVGDMWVHIGSFVQFENDFSKETKKFGFDLHKIYYGKSFAELKRKYARYGVLKESKKEVSIEIIKESDWKVTPEEQEDMINCEPILAVYTVKVKTGLFNEIILRMVQSRGLDNKQFVVGNPISYFSGYGKTLEKAMTMMEYRITEYFTELKKMPIKKLRKELVKFNIQKVNMYE